jgi:di/tricarboxylate transporter
MARNGLPGFETQSYLYNLLAHAFVAFAGFAMFGGLTLFRASASSSLEPSGAIPLDAGADSPSMAFERRHWITIAVIAALIVSAIGANVHVGMGAFLGAVILVLTGSADDVEGIKRMPWRVIVMVCGVTVLISLVEKAQGLDLVVSLVAKISSANTVTAVVAFLTGVVSVYSSTSGVVLPAFLPIVPGLAQQLPGASALGIAMSMNVSGHLVDLSPLSTLGALCIAAASADESRALFNKLLAWGLSMTVVGALFCYIVF